jgi:CDP-6-deoxy-D-xylo-4-hexulose-3-dehydrase
MTRSADDIRREILALTAEYCRLAFGPRTFEPGRSAVPVAGRVFDERDMQSLVASSLDFWLTAGPYATQFETQFAQAVGARYAMLVNSGSSANLLACSALFAPEHGERAVQPGDEIITVAAGFPTTVSPILQNGAVPVYVDVDVPTYNVDVTQLEAALSPRSKAIMLAHTLGNPFNVEAVAAFARKHQLWLVEDCCDALGARFGTQHVGTFGDVATCSFYPAHHITMGEGGCVFTSRPLLKRVIESLRDWGRDCWCPPGQDNTCGKRFGWKLGDLPDGYDHKYTYSRLGYNLKVTDMQAAIGVAQLQKLPDFIAARRRNFDVLYDSLRDLQEFLILPEATPGSQPSWFGFPIAVRPESPVQRDALVRALEANKIATRLLFGGNLVKQPGFKDRPFRQIGDLARTDFVMRQVFWIGIYPGLTPAHLDYVQDVIHKTVLAQTGQ